ncbi:type III polyketide synthase [Acidobacteria bacterium AH-259-D05]|nr:type III polyketide synthase [Acidobacteria bacterium AH-259-D05]
MPRVVAVATAVPPFRYDQQEIREVAEQHFQGNLERINGLIGVFDNVQIHQRFFCIPLEWFHRDHTFTEKNEEYIRWSKQLSLEAIENCLSRAGLNPAQIDHLIFVSTSGMATPSIDAHIVNKLRFDSHTKRTPIFGLGCAGGAAGLSRCYDLAKGAPEERILLVSVELSSLTFQSKDYRKSNLIASALFSDGAAAVVVCGDACPEGGIQMVDTFSTLWPNTLDVMGWDFSETGLSVVFSRDIPDILNQHIKQNICQFLTRNQLNLNDLNHFVIHPGGAKILLAFEKSLNLRQGMLDSSRAILENYGNMSSPTLLFILEHLTRECSPKHTDYGLCAAFGPGFSSELILLRW